MGAEHRIGPILAGGVGLILAAYGVAWFLENFERQTLDIDVGFSAAARRNPFLAAERFLTRLEIPVESLSGRGLLRNLPPTNHVLIVNGLGALNPQRREDLHQWLSAGGRILLDALSPWQDEDAPTDDFLAGFGVRVLELDSVSADAAVTASTEVEGYPYPLEVGFLAKYSLEDRNDSATGFVTADGHYRLLQYTVGEGSLTVFSDNGFMINEHIGERDHALFLALLAAPGDRGKVWLLYDGAMPGLGELLWRNAPSALISGLCLIVILLWHLGGRLGPPLPRPSPTQRDLLVHLQASARFLWRHGRGNRLTQVTRKRVEQAWLRNHPVLRGLNPTQRAAWIGEHAGLPQAQVGRALYPAFANDRDLVADSALLQRLWLALSSPGDRRTAPAARHGFSRIVES